MGQLHAASQAEGRYAFGDSSSAWGRPRAGCQSALPGSGRWWIGPPPAAATCAGSSNYTSSPPDASVSRRRWRSTGTDTDAPSRNFSGLMPSSDGSWAWQNWGLPQILVNVPKGEKERETERCKGFSPVTQMPTMNSFLQNMFGQRWYLLAPPRSVKSDQSTS